jgi:hypothetical protein
MSTAPRNVRWLGVSCVALLTIGLCAYGNSVLTGSYDLLVLFFHNAGAAYFLCVTAVAACFAYKARSQFDSTEPMHLTWTMVFLSGCCQFTGLACSQVLSMDIAWNPLVWLGALNSQRSLVLHDIGLVINSPVAMSLLACGLGRVLIVKRQLGLVGRLTVRDRMFIGAVLVFTASQIFEMGRMLAYNRAAVNATQVLLWFTDPLLAVLLIQAVSIRRLVVNLGDGLVARCWWMMAAGVICTSAGNAVMWATNYSMIPQLLVPLGWFIWFLPVTAFACAPCYQLEAVRQAHEGSYARAVHPGQAVSD